MKAAATICLGFRLLSCRVVLALVGCLCQAGCGSGGHRYSPDSLPVELRAAKAENAQTLDLSKLATYSMNSELIDRGDVLSVAINAGYGSDKVETMPVRVGEDGVANVPIIGRVTLAGIELQGAEQLIAAAAVERGLFRNPTVTVTMNRRRMNRITVIGAVEKPGVYELPRGASNLLAAIVAADGLAKEAGTDVEIRRPARIQAADPGAVDRVARQTQLTGYSVPESALEGPALAGPAVTAQPVSYHIDLTSAAKQGSGGQQLQDGDVVMIERRDPQPIHVIGLVARPGQFEVPVNRDLHVLDAIAMAGGVSINVAEEIHVLRRVPGKDQPAVIEVSYKDARAGGSGNLRLAPGDVVSVEETPTTVFFDSIRTFFRVGFTSALPVF